VNDLGEASATPERPRNADMASTARQARSRIQASMRGGTITPHLARPAALLLGQRHDGRAARREVRRAEASA
jgi:hypothetical protein